MDEMTLGVIVGNRDFFPDALVTQARQDLLDVLARNAVRVVILDEEATKRGAVETWDDAKKCAELFKAHGDEIDGILVSLPNFGDEKGIAETIKLSGLQKPILVQAYPDDLDRFDLASRRDPLLRQDICLQQPAPVSPALLADDGTYRRPAERRVPVRSILVPRGLPDGERVADGPAGRDRRAPECLQYGAL